ncbi:hypothetical protein ACHAXA_008839 [Cyclostephanos tholiformis]|uniref:Uncharacterized protein n=1 Tax=Cyclostephanos tholiformis TaxID=382380 RepID=A0ABD3SFL1_9STRA
MRILDDDATDESSMCDHRHHHHHRHELGKIYNGLAALEATMDGGVDDDRWERAMSLFREAERNYLHGFVPMEEMSNDESGVNTAPPRRGGGTTDIISSSIEVVTKTAIERMTPRRVESLVNVRSNMGELLRKLGRYEAAAGMIDSALDVARMALEVAHERSADDARKVDSTDLVTIADVVGRGLDEQRNSIVDLLLQKAGILMSANSFDEAAEAYERALSYHVSFRRWNEGGDRALGQVPKQGTVLPANNTVVSNNPPKLDLAVATKIEATIRHNLGYALAQIGQDALSLEHYAASLAIKRHIVGDMHLEVANTLMDMGALIGGPLRDFTKALNCFKEALYIYRANLEECSRARDENRSATTSTQTFFDDEESDVINMSIEKALKNISLIDAALLKDRDGASSNKRR